MIHYCDRCGRALGAPDDAGMARCPGCGYDQHVEAPGGMTPPDLAPPPPLEPLAPLPALGPPDDLAPLVTPPLVTPPLVRPPAEASPAETSPPPPEASPPPPVRPDLPPPPQARRPSPDPRRGLAGWALRAPPSARSTWVPKPGPSTFADDVERQAEVRRRSRSPLVSLALLVFTVSFMGWVARPLLSAVSSGGSGRSFTPDGSVTLPTGSTGASGVTGNPSSSIDGFVQNGSTVAVDPSRPDGDLLVDAVDPVAGQHRVTRVHPDRLGATKLWAGAPTPDTGRILVDGAVAYEVHLGSVTARSVDSGHEVWTRSVTTDVDICEGCSVVADHRLVVRDVAGLVRAFGPTSSEPLWSLSTNPGRQVLRLEGDRFLVATLPELSAPSRAITWAVVDPATGRLGVGHAIACERGGAGSALGSDDRVFPVAGSSDLVGLAGGNLASPCVVRFDPVSGNVRWVRPLAATAPGDVRAPGATVTSTDLVIPRLASSFWVVRLADASISNVISPGGLRLTPRAVVDGWLIADDIGSDAALPTGHYAGMELTSGKRWSIDPTAALDLAVVAGPGVSVPASASGSVVLPVSVSGGLHGAVLTTDRTSVVFASIDLHSGRILSKSQRRIVGPTPTDGGWVARVAEAPGSLVLSIDGRLRWVIRAGEDDGVAWPTG
ncbi:MAG: hypothetical protein JWM89_3966 [Acidimicrobiales bacterium]|nr:hypothetical protein [Acidimicrobiales bacterium]